MLIILILWAFVFLIFYFTGVVFCAYTKKLNAPDNFANPTSLFFIGLVITNLICGFTSIFSPVNNITLGILICLLVIAYLFKKNEINDYLKEIARHIKTIEGYFFLIGIILIAYLLLVSSQKIIDYDTGLYHSQSIKWIKEYAVVPGLGNLHGRFAFNSMFFVLSSLFSLEIINSASHIINIYPVNGIASIVLLLSLIRKITAPDCTSFLRIFYSVIIILCLAYFSEIINAPQPDIISAIIILYIAKILFETSLNLSKHQYYLVLALIFSCISFKLSTIFLVIAIPFLLKKKHLYHQLFSAIVFPVLILSPYFIRNYYLSGYILYPFPMLDIFSVDWKIPLKEMVIEKQKIVWRARVPLVYFKNSIDTPFNDWILNWFIIKDRLTQILLVVNFSSVFTLVSLYYRKQFVTFMILLLNIIILLFWFSNAPNPRFAYGFLFIGAGINLAHILTSGLIKYELNYKIVLSIFFLIAIGTTALQSNSFNKFKLTTQSIFTPAEFPTISLKKRKTNFVYYYPKLGDRCFSSAIPCASIPKKGLVLRDGTLQKGFKIRKK